MATLDESSVELGRTVKVTLRLSTLDAKMLCSALQ